MKKLTVFFLLMSGILACEKEDENKDYFCYSLTPANGWETIDFKTGYTIQLPDGYTGSGMVGFEGNTFFKNSPDEKIKLSYFFCGPLWCDDFGDTISMPYPEVRYVMGNFDIMIPLDQREYFCLNSEITGVLYYTNDDISKGILYWKDNGYMKAALGMEFYQSEQNVLRRIIQSIKQDPPLSILLSGTNDQLTDTDTDD